MIGKSLICPVCKAENRSPNSCRRCKADLTLLWDLKIHYDNKLAEALDKLRVGELDEAEETLQQVSRIRATPEVTALFAILRAKQHRFHLVWQLYSGQTANNG
jgi:hypothetical protein